MKGVWRWLSAQPGHQWGPAVKLVNGALFFSFWPLSMLFGECMRQGGLLTFFGWTILPAWGIVYLVVLGTFAHVTRLSDRIERLENELILLRSQQARPNP
jgi:hypothetical protein